MTSISNNNNSSGGGIPSSSSLMISQPIINWEEAMQQVGEDEEFLRELLSDLRTELETQLTNIASIIHNPQDAPYHRIMRAAHVMKGAAANLMCYQLRQASLNLEQAASRAHDATTTTTTTVAPIELQQAVQLYYTEMQQAGQNYISYLQSIGV